MCWRACAPPARQISGCIEKCMPSIVDYTGKQLGRLSVIERLPPNGRNVRWLCRCACGRTKVISSNHMRGRQSCGCLRDEVTVQRNVDRSTHSQTGSPEYRAWIAAKMRCLNPNNASFSRYGGAGITICDQWQSDFMAFYRCIGPRPSMRHSLDRFPNRNGNYEPGNVRWANKREQTLNRDVTLRVVINGKSRFLCDVAKERGISLQTVRGRIARGWPVQQAISIPANIDRLVIVNGQLVDALRGLLPAGWDTGHHDSDPGVLAARLALNRAGILS